MMPTKREKMLCDFVVRYGNDRMTARSFYDTYDQILKEFESIKLDLSTTWKEIIWEPLDKKEVQVVVKEEEVKIVEILGKKFVVPVRGGK